MGAKESFKYHRVKEHLLRLIRRRGLRPGDALPSEHALKRELGVGQSTVVRALREMAQAGVLTRIQGKGTVVGKARTAGDTVALVVCDHEGGVTPQVNFAQRLRALTAACANFGAQLSIRVHRREGDDGALATVLGQDPRIRGVLLYESWGLRGVARALSEAGIPSLILYGVAGDPPPVLRIDDRGGGESGMRFLLGRGLSRVAVLSGDPRSPVYRERIEGCRNAWAEAGKPRASFELASSGAGQDSAWKTALALLGRPVRPQALFCLSDFMAMAALEAAESLGLKVPDDLSILGFDGLDFSAHTRPPLSTLAIDHGAVAAAAMAYLSSGRPLPEAPIPVRLLIRRSTTAR